MKPSFSILAVAIVCALSGAEAVAAGCSPPFKTGATISLGRGDIRSARLVEQTIVDNPAQSTLRQKVVLNVATPTESQLQEVMMQLFDVARRTCRKHSLEGVLIFAYGPADDTTGALWAARLNTDQMRPTVDLRRDVISPTTARTGMNCVAGKEPGKSIPWPHEVALPSTSDRRIVGTWVMTPELTISIEETSGKSYTVIRSKYCESGSRGVPLSRQGNKYVEHGNSSDKYYVIARSGQLMAYDRQGFIESYDKRAGLWARQ